MNRSVRIGVVGDYRADNRSHVATTNALRHAARVAGVSLEVEWIHTSRVQADAPPDALRPLEGIFLAPGSPYANLGGALAAIRFAREQGVPMAAT